MNAKQISTAQMVTKKEYIQWKVKKYFSGELSFSMQEIGDTVFIHGSNTETTHWSTKQFIVQVFIGPRGGITKIQVH